MNTRDVFVDHLAYALGDSTNTVEEAASLGLLISAPSLLREAGFSRHYICSEAMTSYDLAKQAVEKIRENLSDVGAIIYSSCIPMNANIGRQSQFRETRDVKHLMDFPASHLQSDFGLDRATVIGLSQQACTAMLGSLRLARMVLTAEPEVQAVLCLSSDRFPEGALYEQSYNLISDGAAACIVSLAPSGFRLVAAHAVTNGALANATDDETVGTFFNYAHRIISETLTKAKLEMRQIKWVVAQNMNASAWKILSRLLSFDYERVCFPTLTEIGHVISGDNVINLQRVVEEGKTQTGDLILLFMAGYGLNWQSVILEKI